MKPGITGLWQVSGRSDLGFDDWMALDVRYLDRWSFGLDLWLLPSAAGRPQPSSKIFAGRKDFRE